MLVDAAGFVGERRQALAVAKTLYLQNGRERQIKSEAEIVLACG